MVIVCKVMGISVLGPLRLSVGDRQVPLPAKQAILLAILALQPNRTVSTDRLIEALWGEDRRPISRDAPDTRLPAQAAARGRWGMRTTRLGSSLRAAATAWTSGPRRSMRACSWGLSPTRAPCPTPTRRGRQHCLSEALALWRGPDVAEVGGEPAATAEIERLQEVRTSAVDELVRVRLGLGETDALVADLRKAVSEAPYREQLWASLMLALARSGQRAQALLAYRDAEAALRRELDVGASHELQELAARIQGG